jgi:cell division septal protein FtsQ
LIGRRGRGRGNSRYEVANRRRGERAREHLTRQRQRDLRRRKITERERERARSGRSEPTLGPRLKHAGLFILSLAAGLLLASPIQQTLTSWTGGGLSRLESIAIQGNDHLSFEHVALATGVAPGSVLSDVVPAEVEARLRADPWIREAQVVRLPPSTLLVRVLERRARAVLVGEEDLRLVDDSGNPFATASAEQAAGLPRIVGGRDLPSHTVHALLITGLDLVERMHAIGVLVLSPEGRLDLHLPSGSEPEGWRVHAPDRDTWVVLGHEDPIERFERLVELLENEEVARSIEGGRRRIDLRFTGQAVLSSEAHRERQRIDQEDRIS